MPPLTFVTPLAVIARLADDTVEWAFIDLREPGEVAEGHPFGSVNIPYSRLEYDCHRIIPRRETPIVMIDAGDGLAYRSAQRLQALGWMDIAAVTGGIPGWQAAGLPLFKGQHSASKAFGEWVEHTYGTPDIGPDVLVTQMQGDADQRPALIDCRPLAEHRAFTVPGSISCPNAELALRLPSLLADDRPVVIHCAGRTRSIIGAQTLRDFGFANPVVALRDGTQGWELAGHARVSGSDCAPPDPLPQPMQDRAITRARQVMARFAIPSASAHDLNGWLASGDRTIYRFDPRPEGEGTPPPGFLSAPATTLVQQTDRFIAVRGARIAVFDPLLVRAVFAAHWLRRMGLDAWVIEDAAPLTDVAPNPPTPCTLPLLDAQSLQMGQTGTATLLDLRPSASYLAAHVAGAIWSIRPRLHLLQDKGPFILLADTAPIADLAAQDLVAAGHAVLGMHLGTPAEWQAAGLPVVSGGPHPTKDDRIDEVFFCAGRHRGNLADARAYLEWETGLIDRLEKAGISPWPTPSDTIYTYQETENGRHQQ